MSTPACFIIMPFGKKQYRPKGSPAGNWKDIDYDTVYTLLIEPAVRAADMEPVRADREAIGGIIHKPMFERILLSEYVVADLTGLNANVFYELGIRHAVRPYTTVNIFAKDSELPFDTNAVRTMPYDPDALDQPSSAEIRAAITKFLVDAKDVKLTDSPVFQLVNGIRFQNSVAHEKTDIFRKEVEYDQAIKDELEKARNMPESERLGAIDKIAGRLNLKNEETGVLIDIMLSYRAIGEFRKMVSFIEQMPLHVQHTVMVQEQYGFALNRIKDRTKAKRVLGDLIRDNPPSSETYGILGRVYKDEFELADSGGDPIGANGFLLKAIETYRNGFEADWRDAYPGINLVTLLEIKGSKDEVDRIWPVVEYAVRQKLKKKDKPPDYWDYATLLELEVIRKDRKAAGEYLQQSVSCPIEHAWMFDTTIKNLSLLRKYRHQRNESVDTEDYMIGLLQQQKKNFEKRLSGDQ
jgi:tetratricopeptide (TPR) repeat protein